ncbi:MAG: FAD-dependent oxidoreductase [Gemmatimonadota bacterium]
MEAPHRVVIVGGGLGGLHAARRLADASPGVTLIDRRHFRPFQPPSCQVATGGVSPANITVPVRGVSRDQTNARVLPAEVKNFATSERKLTGDRADVAHDALMAAPGATDVGLFRLADPAVH